MCILFLYSTQYSSVRAKRECRRIVFLVIMVSQVVESSSALILLLKTEDLKSAWQYYLALATYKAPVSL